MTAVLDIINQQFYPAMPGDTKVFIRRIISKALPSFYTFLIFLESNQDTHCLRLNTSVLTTPYVPTESIILNQEFKITAPLMLNDKLYVGDSNLNQVYTLYIASAIFSHLSLQLCLGFPQKSSNIPINAFRFMNLRVPDTDLIPIVLN